MTCGTLEFAPLVMWVVPVTLAQHVANSSRNYSVDNDDSATRKECGDFAKSGRRRLLMQLNSQILDQVLEEKENSCVVDQLDVACKSVEVVLDGCDDNDVLAISYFRLKVGS